MKVGELARGKGGMTMARDPLKLRPSSLSRIYTESPNLYRRNGVTLWQKLLRAVMLPSEARSPLSRNELKSIGM